MFYCAKGSVLGTDRNFALSVKKCSLVFAQNALERFSFSYVLVASLGVHACGGWPAGRELRDGGKWGLV